jgi:hypothetical protein
MARRPVVLVHGYSDQGASFNVWRDALGARGIDVREVYVASYISRSNEVTVPDVAEAFDRALRNVVDTDPTKANTFDEFDAIVHSTGMLVLRDWMSRDPRRLARVKHIVGLAPATWGSPLAHKGRSFLGAIFKGEHEIGPDFLEAGDRILTALELGSDYTWRLAEHDLVGKTATYGNDETTPWAFVLVGNKAYGGLRRLVNEPGTDGTVRWAGVGLNSRKITIDLTMEHTGRRWKAEQWHNVDVPLVFVDDRNHGSILHDPPAATVDMVFEALNVADAAAYKAWKEAHEWRENRDGMDERWQQFVIRAVDDRGDAVPDWYLELCTVNDRGDLERIDNFDLDVHTFAADTSYRCFHVDLRKLTKHGQRFGIRVAARSGSELVAYYGVDSQNFDMDSSTPTQAVVGNVMSEPGSPHKWDARLAFATDDAETADNVPVRLFAPFTTTMIELKFNREPMPPRGRNKLLWFLDD